MSEQHSGQQLIFTGGAPRSGTSMLQSMLDSHPDIFGGPEFDHIPTIINLRNQLQESVGNGRIDTFCDNAQVDHCIAGFIEQLLLPAAKREKKRWVSEKTPMNITVFGDLLDIFPEARFIHVVRDPRAVAVSMFKVADRYRQKNMEPPAIIANPGQVSQTILQCVSGGIQASNKAPDRVHTLKYEELLLKTDEITRDLCAFLNVTWSELMLYPGERSHTSEKLLIADGGLWADDRQKFSSPEKTRLDNWKEGLNRQQLEELANAFRPVEMYQPLGYHFDDI